MSSDLSGLDRRVRRIESLLEVIAARLEITPAEIDAATKQRVSDEVVALAHRGQKIAAIKLLREQEHLGLAEAKRVVDDL